jgi:hypothetical protein
MDVICHHLEMHRLNLDLNPTALNPRKNNRHKIIVLVRKIFRPNIEEAKGGRRTLRKNELDDKFCSSLTSYFQVD